MNQPDGPIAQLKAQLAALRQENVTLRSQLEICQSEQRSPSAQFLPSSTIAHEPVQCAPDDSSDATLNHRLLAATAKAANALLTIAHFDTAVKTALQLLGEALDTDRINIVEKVDQSATSAFPGWRVLEYEWKAPGTAPQSADQNATQGSYEEIPEFFARLHQEQTVSYLIEAAPEPFRSTQMAIGVKSTDLAPIFVAGQWWGVLGVADCREAKRRGAAALAVLKIAADCIGSAIQRERTQQALLQAAEERAAELAKCSAVLKQSLDDMAQESSLDHFLAQVLLVINQHLEAPSSMVWLYDFDADMVNLHTACLAHTVYHKTLPPCEGYTHLTQFSLNINRDAESLIQNQALVTLNLTDIPDLDAGTSDWLRCSKVISVLRVPLVTAGRVIGNLAIHRDDNEPFPTEKIELAKALGQQVALSIHMTQLAEEAKQAAIVLCEQQKATQERVTALAEANEALKQRDRLLEATVTATHRLLTIANFDQAIDTTLQLIGEILDADRVLVIEHCTSLSKSDLASAYWQALYEWVAPQMVSQIAHPHVAQGNYEGIEEWYEQLIQGQPISYLVEEIPEPLRSGKLELGLKALHDVPIFVEGKYWGVVGFDDCREAKRRSPAEFAVVRIAADCIGSAIQQQRTRQALLQAEQERAAALAKANAVLAGTLDRLAKAPDPNAFLGYLLLEIAKQMAACKVHLFLYDAPTNTLTQQLCVQEGQIYYPHAPNDPSMFRAPFAADITPAWQFLLERRETIVSIGDYFTAMHWPETVSWHRSQGHNIRAASPLLAGEQPIGLITIAFREKQSLQHDELELLRALANQATLAIQLTRLTEEAQQAAIAREQEQAAQERAAELAKANKVLRRTAAQLVEQQDLNHFLNGLLLKVAQEVGAVNCSIFLCDRQAKTNRMAHAVQDGQVINLDTDPRFALWRTTLISAENKNWKLIQSRGYFWSLLKGEIEDEIQSDKLCDFSILWHHEMQHDSVMCVLLQVGDEPLGYMGLCFRGLVEPSPERISLIQALANQAALAIQLTQLAGEAQQAAIAREQEQAAQAQAAELSRANSLLRNSLSRSSSNSNLNDVLGHLLVELVGYVGASVGHIFIYDACQNTLNLKARCRDGQAFWTPAEDEPIFFQSPIAVAQTQIFTQLCAQPRLAILNQHEFEGHMWQGVLEWFQANDYRGTSSCILMVGDRPFGMLAMAFDQPISFSSVEEELILALAQQIALVIQLTVLSEADKQSAIAREQEKAAQERAAELAKANEVLKRSLTLLAQEPSLNKFLGYVLQTIADQLGDRSGAVYLYNEASHTSLMHLNYEDGQLQRGDQISHPGATLPRSPRAWNEQYLPLLRQNQLLIHHDSEFDSPAYAPYRQYNRDRGVQTLLIVPMLFGGTLLGNMTLRSTQHRDYTPEDLELARALAQQATLAVQLTQLAEQRRQTAVLEERNRMAREIHDTIAQGLSGIVIQLQAAAAIPNAIAQQEHLTQARQLAEQSLTEARRSVQALRPQPLDTASLSDALTTLTAQLTHNTAVQATFRLYGTPYPLPSEVETHLFRITQESITNTLKHAHATQLQLKLVYQPSQVQLTVQDDGQGFDPHASSVFGYGILGMQERAQMIGAVLIITSQPGQDTTITVSLPISPSIEALSRP